MPQLIRSSRPVRWASLGVACLLALPLPLGFWAGFHLRLSPFLALQSLLSRSPLSLLALPAALVLLLVVWRERWFCLNVCPTGALCDAVSACRKQAGSWDRFPQVNKVLVVLALTAALCGAPLLMVLDPIALFHGAWSPLYQGWTPAASLGVLALALVLTTSLLFPRLWCLRLCPLGGLQVLAAEVRKALRRPATNAETPPAPNAEPVLGRRSLFAVIAGVAGGLVLRRAEGREATVELRPPGALPDHFTTTCCRCGNCMRTCPTRIIHPGFDDQDPLGLLAPRLDLTTAWCRPDCIACGQACPTGAIVPFTVDDKKQLFIGTAEIRLDDCLVVQGRECNRCVVSCTYGAIEITGDLFEPKPEVDLARCVGCGACVPACPPGVIGVRPKDCSKIPETR